MISLSNSAAYVVIRWIAVFPVAIVAYLLANFCVILAIDLFGLETTLRLGPDIDSFVLNSFLCPFCFVWFGAKTAPRYIPQTALALFIAQILFSFVSVIACVVWGERIYGTGASPMFWKIVISNIIGIGSSLFAYKILSGKNIPRKRMLDFDAGYEVGYKKANPGEVVPPLKYYPARCSTFEDGYSSGLYRGTMDVAARYERLKAQQKSQDAQVD